MNQSNIDQVQQQQILFLWNIISCLETEQVIIIKRSGLSASIAGERFRLLLSLGCRWLMTVASAFLRMMLIIYPINFYNFLLGIHSNPGPSYRFRDSEILAKNCQFFLPRVFHAPRWWSPRNIVTPNGLKKLE